MLYLFLLIGQLMAMEGLYSSQEEQITPLKKRTFEQCYDRDSSLKYRELLEETKRYKSQLKHEIFPDYSKLFIEKIETLTKENPNFIKLIYGKINIENFSIKFAEYVKKSRSENKENLSEIVNNGLSEINSCLSSPIKVGTNTYHFPKQGWLPEETPRKKANFIRLFVDDKMPVYIVGGQEIPFQLHHLLQHDQHEHILFLTKKTHQEYSSTLHTSGKKSEINRSSFARQKKIAAHLYFIRKIEQVLEILIEQQEHSLSQIKIETMKNLSERLDIISALPESYSVERVDEAGIASLGSSQASFAGDWGRDVACTLDFSTSTDESDEAEVPYLGGSQSFLAGGLSRSRVVCKLDFSTHQ